MHEDIKQLLLPVMKAIATAAGHNCEVVLHLYDGEDPLSGSIAAIENGHVTGREVGGPSTSLGFQDVSSGALSDRFKYRTTTVDGRTLRSSSVYLRDSGGRPIGALCINVDLSAYERARWALEHFINEPGEEVNERFSPDIEDLLSTMIGEAVAAVGRPTSAMSRDERVQVIAKLDRAGAFRVKRAIDRVAAALGVSRPTVYSCLEAARSQSPSAGTNNNRPTTVDSSSLSC